MCAHAVVVVVVDSACTKTCRAPVMSPSQRTDSISLLVFFFQRSFALLQACLMKIDQTHVRTLRPNSGLKKSVMTILCPISLLIYGCEFRLTFIQLAFIMLILNGKRPNMAILLY